MPYDSYGNMTARRNNRRQKVADAMIESGNSTEPVGHWMQGAARAAQGAVGGAMKRKLNAPARPTQLVPKKHRPGRFGGMVKRGLSGMFGG